jgi:DNA-binding CsgD family transcriptional regulator/PAS domain-containing protein
MGGGAVPTEELTSFERKLRELVRSSPYALYLVRLSDTRILEASDATCMLVKRSRDELLSMSIVSQVKDPVAARKSFDLLAAGLIDSYTRQGDFLLPDGSYAHIEARYTTCLDNCPRTAAVGQIITAEAKAAGGELARTPEESVLVLGTVDSEWRIDRVTSDASQLLNIPPEELLGRSAFTFVHPEDVSTLLLLAAHASDSGGGASGRVRLRDAEGEWLWCRLSLHALIGAEMPAFAFSISAVGEIESQRDARSKELEEHLRRIAREIASSGVAALSTSMPTSLEVPEISSLTSREYEIVVRLARGERIATIARGLFLSESTVRNHLTSVYRKFGVQSQAQLLARLHAVPSARV